MVQRKPPYHGLEMFLTGLNGQEDLFHQLTASTKARRHDAARNIQNDLAFTQLDKQLRDTLDTEEVTGVAAPQPDPDALVELGRMLFFDKELSGNRNISCATCHHPVSGTGDALPVSIGEGGEGLAENREQESGHLIPRNAPHVFNGGVAGVHSMFWDSRVTRDPATGQNKF